MSSKLRGKILFQPSIKENTLAKAAAYCAYDELSYNVLHNQLLKSTFKRLAKEGSLSKELKQEVDLIQQRFPTDITARPVRFAHFKRVQLHRNNFQYKLLLAICELIWQELLSTEGKGEKPFKNFLRDKKRMAYLFEKFLLNFYRKHLHSEDWRVSSKQIPWQLTPVDAASDAEYIPAMKTDTSLISEKRHIVMDAKYYPKVLKSQYDKEKIISTNLYQIFSYTQNLTDADNKEVEGILKLCRAFHYPTNTI